MKRISRKELIIQGIAWLIMSVLFAVLVALEEDRLSFGHITRIIMDSLRFRYGYGLIWVFPLILLILYNFIIGAALLLLGRTRGEPSPWTKKASISVGLLIITLITACLIVHFSTQQRNKNLFTDALDRANDYEIIHNTEIPLIESADNIREIADHGDHLIVTLHNGTRLIAVFNHSRKIIAVENMTQQ